jgi:4,4'-diaponeurosporenoate glycosyltransferase
MFLDADTFLEPNGLASIASAFRGDGLLSVQPYHLMERAYERLSAFFNIVVMASMRAFSVLGSRARPLGAFGPCIVCTRETYFASGGHESVRGEILEHLALGKEFVRRGWPVRCFGGRGVVSFRMYPGGLRALFAGFARSFATGADSMSVLALTPVVFWIIGAFGVTRQLVQSLVLGDTTNMAWWVALDLAYALQIHWMLYRIGNFGFLTALLFQLPLLFFGAAFCWSLFLTFFRRRVRWKGRAVRPGAGGGAA